MSSVPGQGVAVQRRVVGLNRAHTGTVIVELRSVAGCRNLHPVRQALYSALTELELAPQVIEVVGDYPSPSVLVNGVEVTGAGDDGAAACRLDLPTAEDLRAALRQALAPHFDNL